MSDGLQEATREFEAALSKEAGGWPGGPDWTSEEEEALREVSGEAYELAVRIETRLDDRIRKLFRVADRSDPKKKQLLDRVLELAKTAKTPLNQLGYEARRTYDPRY
jgi:hypothetical protein